jgi:hypothetical protein
MSPGGNEASSGSDTVPPFGFAKADLDADGEASPRERRHRRPFELVDLGQLLAELEMALLGRELAGARDDLICRNLYEPLLGIFVLAGEGFLFPSVAQVETPA